MKYRRLGTAGVKLSEIGLGGWLTFANALEADAARAVMDAAFDVGVNFFDTADAYAEGKCEAAWGELLADHRRESYVLATKVFFPTGPGPNDRGLSRKHIVESCHASLRRLRTDHLDLYQCHRFDPDVPLAETVGAMNDLVRQGKVLYWGFSEWSAEHILQCLAACGDRLERPRSSQPRYSGVERGAEEVFSTCGRSSFRRWRRGCSAASTRRASRRRRAAGPATTGRILSSESSPTIRRCWARCRRYGGSLRRRG
jgi:aryl-alcohol dehydrogenase-like predicted oxidoreductase